MFVGLGIDRLSLGARRQNLSQLVHMSTIASPLKDLLDDDPRHKQGVPPFKRSGENSIGWRARCPEPFDPCRGVDQHGIGPLADLSHVGQISLPARASKLARQAPLFLAADQFRQGSPEDLTRGPDAGELSSAREEPRIHDHVGSLHTPFVHRRDTSGQSPVHLREFSRGAGRRSQGPVRAPTTRRPGPGPGPAIAREAACRWGRPSAAPSCRRLPDHPAGARLEARAPRTTPRFR